jgi:hypothetical protein
MPGIARVVGILSLAACAALAPLPHAPGGLRTRMARVRCADVRARAARPYTAEEVTAFAAWIAEQRRAADMSADDASERLVVVDAGDDVDNTFTFSGVAWQVGTPQLRQTSTRIVSLLK